MAKKALNQDLFREIKKTKSRFISILLLVVIAVSFLFGLRMAAPDMESSMDAYLDNQELMDIRVASTLGLTEEDVRALSQVEGTERAEGAYAVDALAIGGSGQDTLVVKVQSFREDGLNRPYVEEGRLPEGEGECLVEEDLVESLGLSIGDSIRLDTGTGAFEDTLNSTEYIIVGVGRTPLYVSISRGTSTLGSGSVSAIVMLPEDCFRMEAYTDIYLTAAGGRELNAYDSSYEDLVERYTQRLEEIQSQREELRTLEVRAEAQEELDEGWQEYEDGKAEAEQELADAWTELEDARQELEDGWQEYHDGQQELSDAQEELLQGEQELEDARDKLEQGEADYQTGLADYRSGKDAYEQGLNEYNEGYAAYQQGAAVLAEAQAAYDAGYAEYQQGEEDYAAGLAVYQQGEADYAQGLRDYEAGEAAYAQGLRDYEAGEAGYAQGYEQYQAGETAYAEAKRQYDAAAEEFAQKSRPYEEAEAEYASQLAVYEQGELAYSTQYGEYEAGEASYRRRLAQYQQDEEAYSRQGENASGEERQRLDQEKEALDQLRAQLDGTKSALSQRRSELDAAKEQLTETRSRLDGIKAELDRQREPLDQAKAELDRSRAQLDQTKAELESTRRQLDGAKAELEQTRPQLDAAKAELEQSRIQLDQVKTQLDGARAQLDESKAVLEASAAELAAGQAELESSRAQLEEAKAVLDESKAQLDAAAAQLDEARETLDQGWRDYRDGINTLNEGRAELEEGRAELEDAFQTLNEGQDDYEDGLAEYRDAEVEVEEELADARAELADAQEIVDGIVDAEWYILDRTANMGFASYQQDAQRMSKLSLVFPTVFFLVAALVCLTTMTRMVEEQRVQIGGLKALGYTKLEIARKYVGYGLLASLVGGVLGLLLGGIGIPMVIVTCWKVMYDYPGVILTFSWPTAMVCMLAAVICCAAAVLTAALAALKESPAQLMRPKAPSAGKRVWLENIPFLWKRMTFSQKVTARNLFRYQKRFWMTVIGIAGCTGLMISGLGLRDSIMDVIDLQFGNVSTYSASVYLEDDLTEAERNRVVEKLEQEAELEGYTFCYLNTVTLESSSYSLSGNLVSVAETDALEGFWNIKDRLTGEKVALTDQGVVLSEKTAELLELQVGDTISVKDGEIRADLPITGIMENYVQHYIAMTDRCYAAYFGAPPEQGQILLNYPESADWEGIGQRLLELDQVSGIYYVRETQNMIRNQLQGVYPAVMIIILSAGILAFVVLFNLSSINITERMRELATLKVLGFRDNEMRSYVFRENAVLTLIGMAVGIFAGKWFHSFLVTTVEVEMVMFGRQAHWQSYLLAAGLTMLFSLCVNWVAGSSLKKIDMVESLKTVE